MSKNKYDFLYETPDDRTIESYEHNENIVEAAAKIFLKYRKYDEVLCTAEFQSGKTDVMKRLIYTVRNYNDELRDMSIDIIKYNIHLVLCTSSLGLKEQLKNKLSEIKHHIYHLKDIERIVKNVHENESLFSELSDSSLIIFDESHCDAEINKVVHKFRSEIDRFAKHNKTSYYKAYFSATPYEQVVCKYPMVIMTPAPNYYGFRDIFASILNKNTPLIFQAKNLEDPKECHKLFTEIDICDFYYIFRLPGNEKAAQTMMLNIEKEFKNSKSSLDTIIYDMYFEENINELLCTKPNKPVVIYLKDKLRMGEYMDTKYVYMVHDDPKNMFTHTTTQSLIGRCCGYNKKSHQTIIYCDFDKAWEHYRWIKKNYDINYLPSNCKYVSKKGKSTINKCIYKLDD